MNKDFPDRIGIIGGGQLGKMMIQSVKKMGFFIQILDPAPDCPAARLADSKITGDFFDKENLRKLVLSSGVTTFDIERADESLAKLADQGHLIYPHPRILDIIQDKLVQKEVFKKNNIPTPKYKKPEGEIKSILKEFSFPLVQKNCREGYDGKGVFIIYKEGDVQEITGGDYFFEEFIEIEKELAINIARNIKGEIKCHPVVEMVFNSKANICDMVIAPAGISKEAREEVEKIGIKTIKALGEGAVGIFGIEMFLAKNGEILVNEVAPRPHNSGHYTIEACFTSQFEQHIRAITGLPLGATDLLCPAAMVNILGEEGYAGEAVFEGISEILAIPGLSLHIYGKKETRPFRKMGHITVLDKNIEIAIKKAKMAKNLVKVIAKK